MDRVDKEDRERCVRGARRAMFSAIVAFVSDRGRSLSDMASGELAAQTGGLPRRLSRRGGMSVCYSRAYDGYMRRKRGAGMAGGRKNAQLRV